jgi:hypothetical protein
MPYSSSGISRIVWSPIRAPSKAGLYRISISLDAHGNQAIYIGESANVARRLFAYTKDYTGSRTKTTELRVSLQIREALSNDRSVVVDAATTALIGIGGDDTPVRMSDVAQRRFVEAAAVVAESLTDKDGFVVMLNHVSGELYYLEPRQVLPS